MELEQPIPISLDRRVSIDFVRKLLRAMNASVADPMPRRGTLSMMPEPSLRGININQYNRGNPKPNCFWQITKKDTNQFRLIII